jgi:hypothetical protein
MQPALLSSIPARGRASVSCTGARCRLRGITPVNSAQTRHPRWQPWPATVGTVLCWPHLCRVCRSRSLARPSPFATTPSAAASQLSHELGQTLLASRRRAPPGRLPKRSPAPLMTRITPGHVYPGSQGQSHGKPRSARRWPPPTRPGMRPAAAENNWPRDAADTHDLFGAHHRATGKE